MRRYALSYHSIYVRNWRVLAAIWVLSALCTTVLQFLVLVHPSWIGNEEGGYFGLYNYCNAMECEWNVFQVRTLATSFELSALLVLLATILSSMAVFSILLLVLLRDRYVLLLCSWLYLFSFLSLLIGCLIFPYGWDHPRVREVCESKRYKLGLCQLRWPFILALVLVIDQLALSTLGFALTFKRPPKVQELQHVSAPVKRTMHPVPRPRKLSLQESYYSKRASRLDL